MTGGLLQLIAYGSQDLYLTGNPTITFFKAVYRRHTNFSTEYINQSLFVLPSFTPTEDNKVSAKIDRYADLIHDMYVAVDLPNIYSTEEEKFQWIENLGEFLIKSIEITVNGQQIDKLYSEWLNVWAQLNISKSRRQSYNELIGNTPDMTNPAQYNGSINQRADPTIKARRLYIPIPFWFCQNPGLSIPLIALQYTEIYVHIEFRRLNELFTMWYGLAPETFFQFATFQQDPNASTSAPSYKTFQAIEDAGLTTIKAFELQNKLSANGFSPQNYFWYFINGSSFSGNWSQNAFLLINYIYLDRDERKRFAQTTHDYLITQTQQQIFEGLNGYGTLEMKIQHPVKELYYITQRDDVYQVNEWSNYSNCLYHHNFTNNLFIKNVIDLREQVAFSSNQIPTCLGTSATQLIDDPNAFDQNGENILLSGVLKLNGHERYQTRDTLFYNALQPYKYHTHSADMGVNVYSFSLKPEDYQPSGTCNFSRINKSQFYYHVRDIIDQDVLYNIGMYAVNSNVFRIMGGIGSVVFVN